MGGSYSAEEIAQVRGELTTTLYGELSGSGRLPDVGLHSSLANFSGLDSSSVLRERIGQRQRDQSLSPGDFVESLGAALGGLKPVPNAVGLGAVLIGMAIDVFFEATSGADSEDVAGLLREVFAEEKASDVQDQLDEYAKRYAVFLRDEKRLAEETRRLERRLSAAVTRLRNSVLRDGHVNSRAVKRWVNGAAFHVQMVIHLARLERRDSAEARALLVHYRADLRNVLSKYQTYRRSSLTMDLRDPRDCAPIKRRKRLFVVADECFLCDEEVRFIIFVNNQEREICTQDTADLISDKFFSAYVSTLEAYFSQLDKNLVELVNQHNSFFISDFS